MDWKNESALKNTFVTRVLRFVWLFPALQRLDCPVDLNTVCKPGFLGSTWFGLRRNVFARYKGDQHEWPLIRLQVFLHRSKVAICCVALIFRFVLSWSNFVLSITQGYRVTNRTPSFISHFSDTGTLCLLCSCIDDVPSEIVLFA